LTSIELPKEEGESGGDRPLRFDAETEMCVYRVVQEALANALQHADAERIAITMRLGGGRIVAEILDDGRGLQAPRRIAGRAVGLGLTGMHERATLAGGLLRVDAGPRGGTRVTLSVPAKPRTTEPDGVLDGFTNSTQARG
jgi:signal transduction histidine kinase